MYSSGINGEKELRGQLVNPGSSGKLAIKMECVHVAYVLEIIPGKVSQRRTFRIAGARFPQAMLFLLPTVSKH